MIQTGALAILGWTVWYVHAKALPAERKEHLKAQEAARRDFRDSLQSLTTELSRLTAAITGDIE